MGLDSHDQVYARALADIRRCTTGKARRAVVRQAAAVLGVSEGTVYRQLRRRGWDSGRRTRADQGRSLVAEDDLRQVAELMAKGRNKRGQANVPTREAVLIAREQGLAAGELSYAHLCRQLRRTGLSGRHMRAPEPSIARVSTHPNHVWFVDISVAIQWYFRDDKGQRKLGLYSDAGARFYEGKRENLAGRDKVILRYIAVDHHTGAYYVRYYYAQGENSVDVVDFLYRAMAPKFDTQAYPFRGIPRRIVCDQGPAFKASLTQTLLEELGVEVELHAAGNAKASGAVESRHNHWQRSFEGRLAMRPAEDIVEINHWAERFCAVANAERPHSRHGQAPMAMWSAIEPADLVAAPDRDTFLQLAAQKRRTGTLDNYLRLRADGRRWEIRGDHVYPRQKVQYRLAPFTDAGIRVWDAEGQELAATELRFDQAGFPVNGRRHVWDDPEAAGATAPRPAAQVLAGDVAADPDSVRLDEIFDGLDEQVARHAYLAGQQGTPWEPRQSALHCSPLIGSVDAREEIAGRLGRPLTRDEGQWWRERLGDGCSRDELEAAFNDFTQGVSAPATAELIG